MTEHYPALSHPLDRLYWPRADKQIIRELEIRVSKLRKMLGWLLACLCVGWVCVFALPTQTNGQQILDFGASWCGPCQSMRGTTQQLEQSGVRIVQVDTDRQQQLAQQYRIGPIPAFIALDANGREVGRIVGVCGVDSLQALWAKACGDSQQPTQSQSSPTKTGWADPRVVKVCIADGDKNYLGAGSIISINGNASYILSAGHVLGHPGTARVMFNDGKTESIDIVSVDREADCAIARLRDNQPHDSFDLADADINGGTKVFLAGFPQSDKWRGRWAVCSGYEKQDGIPVMVFPGAAIEGESGGPVVDADGNIVGVIDANNCEKDKATGRVIRPATLAYCCRATAIKRMIEAANSRTKLQYCDGGCCGPGGCQGSCYGGQCPCPGYTQGGSIGIGIGIGAESYGGCCPRPQQRRLVPVIPVVPVQPIQPTQPPIAQVPPQQPPAPQVDQATQQRLAQLESQMTTINNQLANPPAAKPIYMRSDAASNYAAVYPGGQVTLNLHPTQ